MAMHKLQNTQWTEYLNRVSRAANGKQVEVEVAGPQGGMQTEVRWAPLNGITYDPKDDLVDISAGSLGDIIEHPREIYVDYQDDGLHALEVVDAEGNHEILKLKQPLKILTP